MPECLNTAIIFGRKFQGFSKSKSRLCIYMGDFILYKDFRAFSAKNFSTFHI